MHHHDPYGPAGGWESSPAESTDRVVMVHARFHDDVRTFYEVPERTAQLVRANYDADPDATWDECLLALMLQREGTYRQVVAENKRLRSEVERLRAGAPDA